MCLYFLLVRCDDYTHDQYVESFEVDGNREKIEFEFRFSSKVNKFIKNKTKIRCDLVKMWSFGSLLISY